MLTHISFIDQFSLFHIYPIILINIFSSTQTSFLKSLILRLACGFHLRYSYIQHDLLNLVSHYSSMKHCYFLRYGTRPRCEGQMDMLCNNFSIFSHFQDFILSVPPKFIVWDQNILLKYNFIDWIISISSFHTFTGNFGS